MSLRYKDGEGEEMIDEFIRQIMKGSHEREASNYWMTAWNSQPNSKPEVKEEPIDLLELIQTKFIDVDEIIKGTSDQSSFDWFSHHSVRELKLVRIHFALTHEKESMLLNLMDFEACIDNPDDFGVSSYIYFMDALIDNAKNVKKLRFKQIILNLLGSDQQVANLFNEISIDLVPSSQAFGKVKTSIQGYHRSRPRLWLAESLHTNFNSPWTVIAFLATIVVLDLTIA